MISTKQRAKLRSIAQKLEPIVIIGKDVISENVIQSIELVIDKRELIKIRLLPNSGLEAKSASQQICEAICADGVQCIGNIVVIYKKSNRNDIEHIL